MSRAPTWRSRWPSRVRPSARRCRAPQGRPLACFGELGLTGELRTVGHGDRRLAEAEKFGLAPVIEPGATRQPARGARRGAGRIASGSQTRPEQDLRKSADGGDRLKSTTMPPRSGEELKDELESRQESRIMRALEMVAPGTALREGIDNIVHAHTGALIVVGDADELGFLFSGGIKLDIDYSPAFLYELAKMDGAIVLQLQRDEDRARQRPADAGPDDPHARDRHPPPDRRAGLQADRRARGRRSPSGGRSSRSTSTASKYILEDIPVVLAKANQALATLDKYRSRLDQVSTRLTALEFEGGVDAPRRAHRAAARRAGDPHGGRDRALHRRARHRGPADRDAARRDDGRRLRRQGGARARLPGRGHRRGFADRVRPARAPAAPGPARLRSPGRAARLRPQAQHP